MDAARLRRPDVLLTQHFLRQFLDNDLISPDSDRSQLVAVVGAMVVSLSLFISTFMSFAYVMGMLMPGQAALLSLSDKFFYVALSTTAAALVAAAQWDALTVDPRDAGILEPLPIPTATIRRAKILAVAILGAIVALALNVFPSVIFPWLLVFNFGQLSVFTLLFMMAAHFAVSVAAAIFGYLTVIAIRETLAALMGLRWFTQASPWLQGAMIVVLGSALLLLPPATSRLGYRDANGWRPMAPPLWFLAAHELAAGGAIAELPRGRMTPRQAAADASATERYNQWRQRFPPLAQRAGVALALAMLLATAAYLWNARRLPTLAPSPPPAFRRGWRFGRWLANTLLVRGSAARAGFYFTLAAMWRSSTHRLTLACSAAAGFAMAVVALWNQPLEMGGGASVRLLAMQPLLYGALLVGFRHIIRVPAELRANWGFQLAWRNLERSFISGVRRAALVALAVPAVAILLPLFAYLLGWSAGLVHAALGLAGAAVLLEALMVSYEKVPFTCSYVPTENMKALGPIYLLAFIVGASQFARLQWQALNGGDLIEVAVALGVLFGILRLMALKRARLPYVQFDEAPATFQRLGLDS